MIFVLLIFCLGQVFAQTCGDVDSSVNINIIDALKTAQFSVGLNPQGFNQLAADVNGNGSITILDALQIAQFSVGLIYTLPGCPATPTPTFTFTPTSGNGEMLPQEGNPVHARFDKYRDWIGSNINETKQQADIILSYQLTNGGFPKNVSYDSTGSGGSASGTIDNGATTAELTFLAFVYQQTRETKYRDGARKALDFLLNMQYSSGGFPQSYPLEGGYHDHVTFNDDAMSRALVVLNKAKSNVYPLNDDVFTSEQRSRLPDAVNRGVDYILKAQWVQNGKLSVWCAQHGVNDYQPKGARAYEHPFLSGSESIEIIGFLMSLPQTPEIERAWKAGVDWFRSPNTYLADHYYDKSQEGSNPFIYQAGSKCWYRFYHLESNEPIFFSNYDGVIWIGLENQAKRKSGYRWGGDFGFRIFPYAESVGY